MFHTEFECKQLHLLPNAYERLGAALKAIGGAGFPGGVSQIFSFAFWEASPRQVRRASTLVSRSHPMRHGPTPLCMELSRQIGAAFGLQGTLVRPGRNLTIFD